MTVRTHKTPSHTLHHHPRAICRVDVSTFYQTTCPPSAHSLGLRLPNPTRTNTHDATTPHADRPTKTIPPDCIAELV